MINIAEILKDCPEGTKLYSPICGVCTFEKVHLNTSIVVCTQDYRTITFNVYGQYFKDIDNAECLLFPSKKNRDWTKFRPFKDGDIISSGSYIAIFHKFGKPKSCEYDKVIYYHCWCYQNGKEFKFKKDFGIGRDTEYNFATDKEKQKLFDIIKANGYKWNPETKTLEKLIVTEFKDGDILTYTGNYTTTFIYRNKDNEPSLTTSFYVACNDAPTHNFLIYNKYTLIALNENCDVRLATEDEKIKLFDAIKTNAYKWNAETKTLEKLIVPKFKVGDKIVKKEDPTKSWYVQGIDTYCNSDYYYIVTKGQVSNLHFKDQDEWELLVITPKFKSGDKIKEKNERFPSTRTIDNYVEGIGYYTTIHDWVRIEDQDNWELVPTHKFKVDDKVKHIHTGVYCHIKAYADELKGYYTSIGHFIKDENVDEWENIPNKFDISTLKAYDKVLVRDCNDLIWVNALFGFYDTSNEKYPFVASVSKWAQCIPYEGNQHLLGTCDDCDEYYKNW